MSDRELLALFIRTGTRGCSALQLADDILARLGGISKMAHVSYEALVVIPGIKQAKAIEILGAIEMSRRIIKPPHFAQVHIGEPQRLVDWLNLEIGYDVQENFGVVFLNGQNCIIGHKLLFKGTLDRSVVHPRDVFREAVMRSCSRLILVHNHPGATMRPSQADITVTEVMVEAATMMGMAVLDHLIVGQGQYFSLRSHYPYLFEHPSVPSD